MFLFPKRTAGSCVYDDGKQLNRCYSGIYNTIDLISGSDSLADNWAACTEMVLGYWGVCMKKDAILSKRYAKSVIWASQDNRRQHWLSEKLSDGLLPYKPDRDINVLSYDRLESIISTDLNQDYPLIIGNDSEVMVLTDMYYVRDSSGPHIKSAIVIDPRPGKGKRDLCAVRMVKSSRRDWRWEINDYYWRNIDYVLRITVTPDKRIGETDSIINNTKKR